MRALLLGISASLLAAGAATALPPPVPLAVTVVSDHGPDAPQTRHFDALPVALAEDGWFALSPSGALAGAGDCLAMGVDRPTCLRRALQAAAPSGPAPRVVLLVEPVDTIRVRASCLGRGAAATDAARQTVTIDYKQLLFADPQARHAARLALAGCLLAARGEAPVVAGGGL